LNPSKDIFKRAEQAIRKGNYEYAIELYLQGLALDPKASNERRHLHQIETRVIENAGGNPQGGMSTKLKSAATLAKVKKLSLQKKWDEVVVEIEKALRTQPQNASLLFQLSQALESVEAVDGAITVLEEITSVQKDHIEAHRKLGNLWAARNDHKKAIEAWEKVKLYKPDDKEAGKAIRDLSASTLVKAVEDKKAAMGDESFRSMLKDEDESADLEKKAKVIRTDEDRVAAIELKKEELKKEPRNSRLWRELGTLYQDLKNWRYALEAYKKALEVNPHDLFAPDKIGSLREHVVDEKLRQKREDIEAATQNGRTPQEIEAMKLELEQEEAKAIEFKIDEYGRRVKAHPTDYELKMRFGRFLMDGKRYDEAIEQFQKAIKDPKFKVASQNCMGQCFQRKGVFAIAIQQYLDALKALAEKDGDLGKQIKYNLAVAFEEKGERDQALKYYQDIMAVDIGYQDVSGRVERLMRG
jgi:tetratricopeptide (TPR) repeat protein